jgi:hypothetical protein
VRSSFKYVAQWLRHHGISLKVSGSKPDKVNFSIYLIPPAAVGPGVHLASNRNEYLKQRNKCFLGAECGRCVELKTSPPSVSCLSRQCGIFNILQPHRPPGPVTGIALLYLTASVSF